jgi:hypothetical protein
MTAGWEANGSWMVRRNGTIRRHLWYKDLKGPVANTSITLLRPRQFSKKNTTTPNSKFLTAVSGRKKEKTYVILN